MLPTEIGDRPSARTFSIPATVDRGCPAGFTSFWENGHRFGGDSENVGPLFMCQEAYRVM